MSRTLHCLLFYLLIIFVSGIDTYYIDPSCGADSQLIQTAMDDAFAMNNQAMHALDRSPRDDNVNRLIKLLFAAPNQDPADVDMTSVRNNFTAIATASNRLTQPPDRDPREVVRCVIHRSRHETDVSPDHILQYG